MTQQPASSGKKDLGSVVETVQASLGISDELLQKLEQLDSGSLTLRGTIDDDYDLPVRAGHGSFSQDKTTFGVTIKGSFEIKSPPDGSWTLTIKDDKDLIKQFTGAVPGKQYSFEYKTGFKLKLRLEADWSEKQDTTLKVHLKATY